MDISLLVLCPIAPEKRDVLAKRCSVTYALTAEERVNTIQTQGANFQAVLTIGTIGLTAAEIEAMPNLQLICTVGVGYETVDVAAAKAKGIVVANGRGANDECVADHTMGLVISCMRGFRELDKLCRAGVWRTAIPVPVNVSGKRLGILGLGAVGEKIAHRAKAFHMPIGYHNRKARPELSYQYFDDVVSLARWSDVLVCAAPGGASTHHLVNDEVLAALGPSGVLVNVGRGSIVDTKALARALQSKQIAAAGIDVYESEPEPPAELIGLDNVLLTPHLAGWSPEAVDMQFSIFLQNLEGFFGGSGAVTPV